MIKRNQDQVHIYGKVVYKAETTTGWAVMIMPDEILIDNYHHGYIHIHLDPSSHDLKIEINDNTDDKIYSIVCNHLEKNGGLILKNLIKELKEW